MFANDNIKTAISAVKQALHSRHGMLGVVTAVTHLLLDDLQDSGKIVCCDTLEYAAHLIADGKALDANLILADHHAELKETA